MLSFTSVVICGLYTRSLVTFLVNIAFLSSANACILVISVRMPFYSTYLKLFRHFDMIR